jgi:hypothetical protein
MFQPSRIIGPLATVTAVPGPFDHAAGKSSVDSAERNCWPTANADGDVIEL